MSNYTSKESERKQNLYGYYCNMCKELNISPEIYINFNDDIYNYTKKLYKQYKFN